MSARPKSVSPRGLSSPHDKRGRRTRARIDQLDAQILQVLAKDQPQSVRHMFYRMTDPRLPEPVEKSDAGYRHVQHRITQLRRSGRLPYRWIADATRRGHHVNTFNSAGEYVRAMAGYYRADLWRDSDKYVEVWTESRSIAGVIEGVCADLAVSLYPCGGFSSITLAFEAAQTINEYAAHGKVARIVYIGDYDTAGVLIDQSLEKELRNHLRAGVDMEFFRLGITAEQIDEYDLPQKPRKIGDRRAMYVSASVEAEAMPAAILRQLLRDHVEAYVPYGALAAAKVAEQSEREGLRAFASILDARGDDADDE